MAPTSSRPPARRARPHRSGPWVLLGALTAVTVGGGLVAANGEVAGGVHVDAGLALPREKPDPPAVGAADTAVDLAGPDGPAGATPVSAAGDSAAGEPVAGDAGGGGPAVGDGAAGDPTAGDPTAGDPVAGDPVAGGPGGGGTSVVATAPGTMPPAAPAPPVDATPQWRAVSVDDPLRIWVGGDSQAAFLGPAVAQRGALALGPLAEVVATDHHDSTGLARPDSFSWPYHLATEVAAQPLDVLVFMAGFNDPQPMHVDGVALATLSPGWVAEYGRRVGEVMDLLAAPGRLLVWVGQPISRPAGFDAGYAVIDPIVAAEARLRPWVRYVPLYDRFRDPATGGYADVLAGVDGAPVRVRQDDGVHLTMDGTLLVADLVLAEMRSTWKLDGAAGPSGG